MPKRPLLLLLLLLLPIVAAACGDDDDPAVTSDAAPATTAGDDYKGPSKPAAGDDGGGGGGLDVTASGFRFSPTELEGAAGELTITASNEDDADHTFTIEALDVDISLPAGGSGEATVTAEAGEYEFVCRIHGSMTGTLTVT